MTEHPATIHQMYDLHTFLIMRMMLKPDSSCVDVGAHVGAILAEIVKLCPNGKHFAFEPIPYLFESLKERFPNVNIYPFACSDEEGASTFFYVENEPGYSGLKKRRYDNLPDPIIAEIVVAKSSLDRIISPVQRIDFIKIDVEGGELAVLRGAKRIIVENAPLIIFESGLGASDYYGTTGEMIFDFLVEQCGLEINTLDGFLCGRSGLTRDGLTRVFEATSRYMFVATRPLGDDERVSHSQSYLLDLDMRLFALECRETRDASCASGADNDIARKADDDSGLKVGSWGPQSMVLGNIPNRQPDGSLGIWIQVSGVQGLGELRVFFDGQPQNTTVQKKLITTGVSPKLLLEAGSKAVIIKQLSTGKTFTVGTFSITPSNEIAPTKRRPQ